MCFDVRPGCELHLLAIALRRTASPSGVFRSPVARLLGGTVVSPLGYESFVFVVGLLVNDPSTLCSPPVQAKAAYPSLAGGV